MPVPIPRARWRPPRAASASGPTSPRPAPAPPAPAAAPPATSPIGASAGIQLPYEPGLYGKAYGLAVGDADADGDGVLSGCDNCPSIVNPDQRNSDCPTDQDVMSFPGCIDGGDVFGEVSGTATAVDGDALFCVQSFDGGAHWEALGGEGLVLQAAWPAVDPDVGTVNVEPGVVWTRLEEELARHGRMLRLYPTSAPGSSQSASPDDSSSSAERKLRTSSSPTGR